MKAHVSEGDNQLHDNKQKETIDIQNEIERLAQQWAAAELRGDVAALTSMLAGDFIGIGPLGFILTKHDWLARHQSGDLTYEAVDLDEVSVRVYDGAAILIGRLLQQAAFRDNRVDAELRTTLVFVHEQGP